MTIIKRADLGRPLTWDELDDNFQQVDDLTAAASAAVSSASASATAAASSATASATSATDAANSAANAAAAIVSAVKSTITFTTGGTLNSNLDRISDGTYLYYWTGTYPVTIPASSTVAGTGGLSAGFWAVDTDQLLRDELLSGDNRAVNWTREAPSLPATTVADKLNNLYIHCYEFASDDIITDKPDANDPTTWDWTPAIDAAIAKSKSENFQPVVLPPHKAITTGGHVLTSSVVNYMGGTTSDGRNYKGVPLIGYGKGISVLMFKPATSTTACISLVGNSGGHNTSAYMSDFSIDAADSTYRYMGYGIELNCVNYAYITAVDVGFLNENYRFLNGITGGWCEFNELINCFSYRGNVCYSFVRTAGNDSFNGLSFTNCFGQIKKVDTGGYGLKLTGVSSSALVWAYGGKYDIKFYGGDALCKVISLSYAEMTLTSGDMHCEGTVTFEALDNYSRVRHLGRFINNGTNQFSVVTELSGAQGRFVFTNIQSKTTGFASSELTGFTPSALPTTAESYSVNGAFPAVFQGTGTNFASPMLACQNQSGNGIYFGQIASGGSLSDFTPSWKLTNDGGILKTYNTTFRFQIGSSETVRVTSAAVYPFTTGAMTLGLSTNFYSISYVTRRMYTSTVGDYVGTGSPEGVLTAGIGSTYRRTDGGTSTTFYVKESGTGNTGWVAK